MLYKDLPVEIQERVKEICREQEKTDRITDTEGLEYLFTWGATMEKRDFWDKIDNGNFSVFYERYSKFPEKWCIKGCRETEEWQRIDMGNKCNWRFDAFRRYYFTTDPELRVWDHTTTIPRGYTEITFEQFKEYILKQPVMKKITLKRSQLLVAYEQYTCGRWKAVITNLLMNNPLAKDNDDIDVSEGIGILKKEGTEEQKKYVESLGIILEEDKNAFVKKFDDDVLGDISNKLFGNKNVLQIAHSATDDNNLKGRSLYISKSYIVELLPPSVGHSGTVIKIEKK